ncbi:MFS transporter [Nocardioides mangrovi]|uniref:MFS transporter n=1 Tax=Nocardioides mangrovi TaxID=2874580 RepID=A0ABS7UEU1_9ACTN|nr:MFS transporter [Nocardioides mangrovi]MBZ5739525.1 MFS transporter [Nocardioides mangrovi]
MPGTRAGSPLLARPAVRRTFACALVGRSAYGVLPLCFLFTVRQATGSFPAATLAAAVLGLATLALPVQARVLDRWGQRRVLPLVTTTWVVLLAAAVLLSAAGTSRPAVWCVLALALGVTAPALGPSMRAQWRWFAEDVAQRRAAYAVDSVGEESLYLMGPIVASVVLATGPARWGLVLVAALAATGTVGLVASPAAVARAEEPGPLLGLGPVRRPGMPRLLVSMGPFGAGTALVYTGVAAAADRLGHPGWAGVVEAGIAAGSVAGGLLWARLRRPPRVSLLLVGLAGLLALAAALPFAAAGVALALGGIAFAPTYVSAYQAADALTPPSEHTEASTLVNTASNLATAIGTALAGSLVAGGVSPYAVAAVLIVAAAATSNLGA